MHIRPKSEMKTLISESSTKSRDPYVLYHDGMYYYCFSRNDKIYLSAAKELDTLDGAAEVIVYHNIEGLKELWAPELHILDGKCYIYVAADDGRNENHRMYVLYNNSINPLDPYLNNGIISDSTNQWAIDGTVFEHNKQRYFIWSGCGGDIRTRQNLYIAQMSSPFQLCSEKILISTPEYAWEKCGGDGINRPFVNEGPAILKCDRQVYLIYSASGCWCADYCLGALKLVGEDPLDAQAWRKYPKPVFESHGDIIGPGHCTFVYGDDNITYMAFHAFNDRENLDLQNVKARYVKFRVSDFPTSMS